MEFKLDIQHDEKKKKFFTNIEGKEAFAEYNINGDVIDFHNTYVPEEYRRKGIAKALYAAASEYVRQKNLKPEPSCSYAAQYFEKHYAPEKRGGGHPAQPEQEE